MTELGRAFSGTHCAPSTGLDTWPTPGATQAGSRLDPYLPVRVVRTLDSWAEIVCSNGWSAWVDVRRLVPLAPAQPPTAPADAFPPAAGPVGAPPAGRFVTPSARTWQVSLGAVVVAVAVFLPWLDAGGGADTPNALDIPLMFLLSWENAGDDGPGLGLAVLVLASLAFVLRHTRGMEQTARIPGGLCIPVVVMFVVQLNGLLNAASAGNPDAPSVLDVIGVGVWVAVGGALLLAWGGRSAN